MRRAEKIHARSPISRFLARKRFRRVAFQGGAGFLSVVSSFSNHLRSGSLKFEERGVYYRDWDMRGAIEGHSVWV